MQIIHQSKDGNRKAIIMADELTTENKALIDTIVEKQEGGWKLSHNSNDPDGGWTYAGVTAKEYNEFHGNEFGKTKPEDWFGLDAIENIIENVPNDLHINICEIYSKKYLTPLCIDKIPAALKGPLFSCAVNCGVGTAVSLLQLSLNNILGVEKCAVDGDLGDKTLASIMMLSKNPEILKRKFLSEWHQHYIKLVVENAKAWQSWGESAAMRAFDFMEKKPTTFRADFLEGWFNRVEFWR